MLSSYPLYKTSSLTDKTDTLYTDLDTINTDNNKQKNRL